MKVLNTVMGRRQASPEKREVVRGEGRKPDAAAQTTASSLDRAPPPYAEKPGQYLLAPASGLRHEDCRCFHFPKQFREGFPAESDFKRTRALIIAEVNDGNLVRMDVDDANQPFDHEYYACQLCGATWKLSFPDQAYRGGLQKGR